MESEPELTRHELFPSPSSGWDEHPKNGFGECGTWSFWGCHGLGGLWADLPAPEGEAFRHPDTVVSPHWNTLNREPIFYAVHSNGRARDIHDKMNDCARDAPNISSRRLVLYVGTHDVLDIEKPADNPYPNFHDLAQPVIRKLIELLQAAAGHGFRTISVCSVPYIHQDLMSPNTRDVHFYQRLIEHVNAALKQHCHGYRQQNFRFIDLDEFSAEPEDMKPDGVNFKDPQRMLKCVWKVARKQLSVEEQAEQRACYQAKRHQAEKTPEGREKKLARRKASKRKKGEEKRKAKEAIERGEADMDLSD